MTAAPIEPRPWPPHRWGLLIALVFAAHIGLVFAFGKRESIRTHPSAVAPVIRLAGGQSELLVNDPTLFALPHPKGFTAAAWLKIPRYDFPPFRWTEQREVGCPLPVEQLGGDFRQFMKTHAFARYEPERLPGPELTMPEAAPPEPPPRTRSTLRISGELAKRPLLNPAELCSWPAPGFLTNTVLQVFVDAVGNVFTVTTLPPGSGSKAADQWAVDFARAARFAPQSPPPILSANPLGPLTPGTLIFQWHTEPLPATNAPPAQP